MRFAVAALLVLPAALTAQNAEADAYTRYELLAPGSAKFKIIYEVTAVSPGATYYFNPIRKGSVATDESVFDRATGKPLEFSVVGYKEAREAGLRANDTTQTYIRVKLTRPVPPDGGEARILIIKTYEDSASYFTRGDTIVFTRPLGIKRNSVVLPKNYELVSSTFPSQVLQEPDGRVGISFWNSTPSQAEVTVRALPVLSMMEPRPSAVADRLGERARQSREIVYFLNDPDTHSFDLYHDYTETRPGTDAYLNIVRAGSTVSNPRARNLDTGEDLKWDVKGDTVFFRFAPVKQGETMRIRMYETYTDTARYKVVGNEMIWDRSFGRPFNAVVLPRGWILTNSSIPATVSRVGDGRTRLDFVNARPDEIAVLITARPRYIDGVPAGIGIVEYRSPAGVRYTAQPDTGPIARAQAALAADPRNVDKVIALGVAQSGARQFREAIETFGKGLEFAPNNAMLYRWRGHRYLSVREFDKADADLTKCLGIDPDNYGCLFHLGIVNFVRGDFNRAVDLFTRAQPRAPDAGELAGSTDWLWMSMMRAGKRKEAAAMLARRPDSLKATPGYAYVTRLKLYRGEIKPDQVFTPADTADVQVATLSYGLGNWYLVRGDTATAKSWFDRAVKSGGWPGFGFIVSEVELRRLK